MSRNGIDTIGGAAAAAANRQTANETSNQLELTSRLTVYESWFSDHKPLWFEIFLPNEQQHQHQE